MWDTGPNESETDTLKIGKIPLNTEYWYFITLIKAKKWYWIIRDEMRRLDEPFGNIR